MAAETNKVAKEFNRLLKKHGLIIAKLHIIDAEIVIQRDLERLNDIPFQIRPSIEMEKRREEWQGQLEVTKAALGAVIEVIEKRARGELGG